MCSEPEEWNEKVNITWREMGAEDIGYLWNSNADEGIMAAFNPKIKLAQGGTLMTGNSFCDNQVSWEEN